MKKIAIYLLRFILNIIYFFMKLRPTRPGKIVFLSRQSDEISEDFRMVQKELLEKEEWLQIVTVSSRLEGENSGGLLKFGKATLKSMFEIANAGVVVLDSYWPAVSILKHKPQMKVIQMWHAMGKIKQSGYQTLGKASGRSREIAELMKMHRGYDYIIAGGSAWNPYYAASFDTTYDKLKNYGLPRIDKLLSERDSSKQAVLEAYPEIQGKRVILYAPTFRRNIEGSWTGLYNALKGGILVVKAHPNQKLEITEEMRQNGVMTMDEFKSGDILSTADYLITDYSAIAVEGAVLGIKTLYYVYDYDEYREKNGMNIDLFNEMPHSTFRSADELCNVIKSDAYDMDELKAYQVKFLPEELGTSTEKIANLILSQVYEIENSN